MNSQKIVKDTDMLYIFVLENCLKKPDILDMFLTFLRLSRVIVNRITCDVSASNYTEDDYLLESWSMDRLEKKYLKLKKKLLYG